MHVILGPDALRRLTASDRETWERLLAHASTSEECPPDAVDALLAIDDFDGWMRRVSSAYGGLPPDDRRYAADVFRRWLSAGIVRAFPSTDRRVLELGYRDARNDTSEDASRHARALVVAVEQAGGAPDLLGRAWLVLARRLYEDRDQEGAIAASLAAEQVFASIDDDAWCTQAVRMRGAALLCARRIDEALAVLDSVGDAPGVFHAYWSPRYRPEIDPVDEVLYRAGMFAMMAPRTDPEWWRTFDNVAKATGHRECARRAEASSHEVLDEDAELPRQMR